MTVFDDGETDHEDTTVKLADFGVSGQLSATMTKKVWLASRSQTFRKLAYTLFPYRIHLLEPRIGW